MQTRFYAHPENTEHLPNYLLNGTNSKKSADDSWFFYHRIAFIATAMSRDLQKEWAAVPTMIDSLLAAVTLIVPPLSLKSPPSPQDFQRAEEALKTFFNVFCHFLNEVKAIDEVHAVKACRVLRDVICSTSPDEPVVQSAIHAIAVPCLPMVLSVLCVDPNSTCLETEEDVENVEYTSMVFTEALLGHTERRLDLMHKLTEQGAPISQTSEICDLLGPYFQALAKLCTESKHARRYCRLRNCWWI
uniref:Uncharacterized protein n=1 Tax=Caenorhabditis japonica TaxID=281687 RepID=A0A8R1E1P2_CAEJA